NVTGVQTCALPIYKCMRCDASFRVTPEHVSNWVSAVIDDQQAGVVCPNCITPDEWTEAQIRGAVAEQDPLLRAIAEGAAAISLEAARCQAQGDEYSRGRADGLLRAVSLMGRFDEIPKETR